MPQAGATAVADRADDVTALEVSRLRLSESLEPISIIINNGTRNTIGPPAGAHTFAASNSVYAVFVSGFGHIPSLELRGKFNDTTPISSARPSQRR